MLVIILVERGSSTISAMRGARIAASIYLRFSVANILIFIHGLPEKQASGETRGRAEGVSRTTQCCVQTHEKEGETLTSIVDSKGTEADAEDGAGEDPEAGRITRHTKTQPSAPTLTRRESLAVHRRRRMRPVWARWMCSGAPEFAHGQFKIEMRP